MADVFGKHAPKIPYQPIADLLAHYARRDAGKLAIVDLDQESSISFGALERAVTDVAAALAQRGVRKGSRVLLLADETLERKVHRGARDRDRSGAHAGAQGA